MAMSPSPDSSYILKSKLHILDQTPSAMFIVYLCVISRRRWGYDHATIQPGDAQNGPIDLDHSKMDNFLLELDLFIFVL